MSSISKAGIFIDIKQLLGFTDQMVGYMTAVDRKRYGDRLVQYNLDMIAQFTLAYHRRDERTVFDAGGKHYDINQKGMKRQHIDDLEASFTNYQTLMEFCFDKHKFEKLRNKRKRRKKKNQFMELMGSIGTGIVRWSGSVYRQVVVSEKDSAQT